MKNRNGKPTAFQLDALKSLGFTGKVKTYRDAENTIKRLRRTNHVVVAKPACTKSCTKKCAAKSNPAPCKKTAVAKRKDKTDLSLPCKKTINGISVTRIIIPNSAAVLAKAKLDELRARAENNEVNPAVELFNIMEQIFVEIAKGL